MNISRFIVGFFSVAMVTLGLAGCKKYFPTTEDSPDSLSKPLSKLSISGEHKLCIAQGNNSILYVWNLETTDNVLSFFKKDYISSKTCEYAYGGTSTSLIPFRTPVTVTQVSADTFTLENTLFSSDEDIKTIMVTVFSPHKEGKTFTIMEIKKQNGSSTEDIFTNKEFKHGVVVDMNDVLFESPCLPSSSSPGSFEVIELKVSNSGKGFDTSLWSTTTNSASCTSVHITDRKGFHDITVSSEFDFTDIQNITLNVIPPTGSSSPAVKYTLRFSEDMKMFGLTSDLGLSVKEMMSVNEQKLLKKILAFKTHATVFENTSIPKNKLIFHSASHLSSFHSWDIEYYTDSTNKIPFVTASPYYIQFFTKTLTGYKDVKLKFVNSKNSLPYELTFDIDGDRLSLDVVNAKKITLKEFKENGISVNIPREKEFYLKLNP
jgi:hypothetical protein